MSFIEVRKLPSDIGGKIVWATDDGNVVVPVETFGCSISADYLSGYVRGLAEGRGFDIAYISELRQPSPYQQYWDVRAAFVRSSHNDLPVPLSRVPYLD